MRRLVTLLAAGLLVAACTSDDDEADPPSTTGARSANAVDTTPPDTTVAPITTVTASRYRATIRRTTDGVPHVLADDLASVMFGQGYASAEDHACTLADQVLKVKGERAKWLGAGDGDAHVNSDFAWRAIGIDAKARADWPSAPDEVKEEMTGFAAGWNHYLDEVGAEGLHGWCAGEDWVQPITPEDLYSYARSIPLIASSRRLAPYLGKVQPPSAEAAPSTTEGALGEIAPPEVASNGWAIGAERSTDGGGMLIANPHFPWEGDLRQWEVHLTVPGDLDVYGANLVGLPGVAVGFTEGVAWTHTVSAGRRFTASVLTLAAGDPTSYLLDGTPKKMTSKDETVEVGNADGTTTVTRTLWFTDQGPVLDLPGIGWTAEKAVTYRDANLDNDEFLEQYLAMDRATTLDELITAHEQYQAVPLFNTIAVSADGRAWYADTSATPNLSPAALAAWTQRKQTDPLTTLFDQQGVTLLDGSTSESNWVEAPNARDPGLVPYSNMPKVERSDYVFNANDSYWLPNADHLLEGDFSPLHGLAGTARSVRTRQNAVVLRDTTASGAAGADGTFTPAELRTAALANGSYTATALKDAVVARCQAQPLVEVPELAATDGSVALPAEAVNLSQACQVLAAWDGVFDLDRAGAALWHELLGRFPASAFAAPGDVWAEPFDPADPVDTPSGLAPVPAGQPDPILTNLARAVQAMTKAGVALNATWGSVQYADRNGTRVGIHGGAGSDGVTNIIDFRPFSDSTEPPAPATAPLVPGSKLTASGYPVNYGTSFLLNVHFTDAGPEAWALLSYSNTGDRQAPGYLGATQRFAAKDWRTVAFTDAQIEADPALRTYEVSGD